MKVKIRYADKEYEVEMDGDSISYQKDGYERNNLDNLLQAVEYTFPDYLLGTLMVSCEKKGVTSLYGGGKVQSFSFKTIIRWEKFR